MVREQVRIINPTGLHARPASVFVKAANGFKSDVAVISGDKRISAEHRKSDVDGLKTGDRHRDRSERGGRNGGRAGAGGPRQGRLRRGIEALGFRWLYAETPPKPYLPRVSGITANVAVHGRGARAGFPRCLPGGAERREESLARAAQGSYGRSLPPPINRRGLLVLYKKRFGIKKEKRSDAGGVRPKRCYRGERRHTVEQGKLKRNVRPFKA